MPVSPTKARPSELLAQVRSLQAVIDSQFAKLQEAQKDKAKLKGYILKYEAELRNWESKATSGGQETAAGASSSPAAQRAQHVSMASPGVDATSASFVVERA